MPTKKKETNHGADKLPEVSSNTSTALPADAASSQPSSIAKPFTETDFAKLAENEHYRYAPNSKKIGHAVITSQNGQMLAAQYEFPSSGEGAPIIRPLIDIEAIEPFRGMHRYRAKTPVGLTPMYATRMYMGKVGEDNDLKEIQIACFSPSSKQGKPPFWGSSRPTPLFRENLSKKEKEELKKELDEIAPITKGGDTLVLDHASVPKRDLCKTRTPDQNTVMGESARDAYEGFFDSMTQELHPEMKQRLKRAFTAEIHDVLTKNYRPEWLHLKGWSLMPMNMNPQTKDNLAAGPKWANTQMMVLERTVKWFALNAPESLLSIKPKFDMLLDTELAKHIDFQVRIQIKNRFVELTQSIDPFQAYPIFTKASDVAQSTAITHSLLHGTKPLSEQIVKESTRVVDKLPSDKPMSTLFSSINRKRKADAKFEFPLPKRRITHSVDSSILAAQAAVLPVHSKRGRGDNDFEIHKEKYSRVEASSALPTPQPAGAGYKTAFHSAPLPVAKKMPHPLIQNASSKTSFPTQNPYEHSVVQVYSNFFSPDYDTPWRDPESSSCTGSGFIIQDALTGKKYILTNAHVAENTTFTQVRLANNRLKKYDAKLLRVAYECDLALFEVEDSAFNECAVPVEFGEMVSLRDEIMVVGFPMGGNEVSLSKGIVSRIQVDDYVCGDLDLLQVQVDAAINPGNSGGPTFLGNKVVGVAFQGYGGHQGLGYIIPMPVVNHFLTETFNKKQYYGFPDLAVYHEELENNHEREFYQMGSRTGVRVKKVDLLSDAYSKLKQDDILLAIDGLPISNEGTVDIPGIGNCINYYFVAQSKFIGDWIRLNILRKNITNGLAEELEVQVTLDTVFGDSRKVSATEHDKMPTYYINSGICFTPLTRNYMQGEGGVFEEMQLIEENCAVSELGKKNAGEQFVLINNIIKCNATQGYSKHHNALVKEINGKTINNMNDVLMVMESHQGDKHEITLYSRSKIIVPNMPTHEHIKLLKRNHITRDRSVDLLEEDLVATLTEEQTTDSKTKELLSRKTKRSLSMSEPEAQEDDNVVLLSNVPSMATGMVTPGMRSFLQKIEEMEERYKGVKEEEEEGDALCSLDDSDSSVSSCEEDETEEELYDTSDTATEENEAPNLRREPARMVSHPGFFNRRSPSNASSQSEEHNDRRPF